MRFEPQHTTVTGEEKRACRKNFSLQLLSRQRILNDHCKQLPSRTSRSLISVNNSKFQTKWATRNFYSASTRKFKLNSSYANKHIKRVWKGHRLYNCQVKVNTNRTLHLQETFVPFKIALKGWHIFTLMVPFRCINQVSYGFESNHI